MKKIIAEKTGFILGYMLLMIPTYILPYFGSNSVLMGSATSGLNPGFWVHLLCLAGLIYIAKQRTINLNKDYLYIFPVIATFFDLTPVLSSIPLVPTVMHILTLILGIALEETTNVAAESAPVTD
ncbi:hypothetical protein [Fodinibius halophilus]|uniref:Uncharacterized protein n=1 Tax=Fodinibius halophilus TaxID=1736908 RepID=A0A6M1T3C8_9BACT|nr:hypothetical protein [Fodinibius halophilus]NGP88587.1 hypothetical protein [Fodinibius halophilus]